MYYPKKYIFQEYGHLQSFLLYEKYALLKQRILPGFVLYADKIIAKSRIIALEFIIRKNQELKITDSRLAVVYPYFSNFHI